METKLIILDFDGTLADTRHSILATVAATLQCLHLPVPPEEDVQRLIGLPLRDTFVRAAHIRDEATVSRAVGIYRELYHDISLRTVTLFPHVAETLQRLHAGSITLAVASSKGREALTLLLETLGVAGYIGCILGEQDVAKKKPAPDMVLEILRRTGLPARAAMVVGDTQYDILMGQNAFCRTCGVTYGNHTADMLCSQGADFVVDDFAQLLEII